MSKKAEIENFKKVKSKVKLDVMEVSPDSLFLRENIADGGTDSVKVNLCQTLTRETLIVTVTKDDKKRMFTVSLFDICSAITDKV